jgi:hypothetical protein
VIKDLGVDSSEVPGQSQPRLLYLFLLCCFDCCGGKAQLSKSLWDAYSLGKNGVQGKSDAANRSGYPACRYGRQQQSQRRRRELISKAGGGLEV